MTEDTAAHAQPLTVLAEDEAILRDSVREFAEAHVRPIVREMDEHAKIPRELVNHLFELGVMGIEIPDAHGGAGTRCWPSRNSRASIRRSASSSTSRTRW